MALIDQHLELHSTAVALRSKRAQVLASNLVNADTPGFQPSDVDFKKILDSIPDSSAPSLQRTHQNHIPGKLDGAAGELYQRATEPDSIDGNAVDSEFERAQFAENALRHQASVQFLTMRINGLIKAIRGD